ncbi:hypothetical protein SAMN05444162_3126 [Paenibacillaceae bacterium GAS479]|nr:hypothetical protein SAMN05444162_3126 [Paenibacillaceae bacterium GAS479]
MVYDGILLGLIVGFIRAGWKNGLIALSNIKIRYGWVFPVLLLVQFLLFYLQGVNSFIASISSSFFMVIYVVGLVLLWLNRSQRGFGMLFAGVFLNFLVMLVNGGRMPVSLDAASVLTPADVEMLKSGEVWFKHQLLDDQTRLSFLGDIIPLGPPYPRKQAISLGDVLMNIGIFFYLQNVMLSFKDTENKLEAQKA